MANKWKGAEKKREAGGFAALPHVVLRSNSYAQLSPHATKLLNDLLAQFNGKNNGDLCMAWKLMAKRGWRSRDTLDKARHKLLDAEWIMVTRQGGKHAATLYALTFYAIDECGGKLDVASTNSPSGSWRKHEPVPARLRAAFEKKR